MWQYCELLNFLYASDSEAEIAVEALVVTLFSVFAVFSS